MKKKYFRKLTMSSDLILSFENQFHLFNQNISFSDLIKTTNFYCIDWVFIGRNKRWETELIRQCNLWSEFYSYHVHFKTQLEHFLFSPKCKTKIPLLLLHNRKKKIKIYTAEVFKALVLQRIYEFARCKSSDQAKSNQQRTK